MIAALDALGGFGGVDFERMQIDFSLIVVHAPPNSPMRTIVDAPAAISARIVRRSVQACPFP